jgi:hypothetical protein
MHSARAVVTGHGKKRDGQILYTVSSQSQVGRSYLVFDYGNSLRCNCQAGQYGKHCAHVEAVRARLATYAMEGIGGLSTPREYGMRGALSPLDDKPEKAPQKPVEKPRPLTAQMSAQALRDTAPLYRSNAGFSIWKV